MVGIGPVHRPASGHVWPWAGMAAAGAAAAAHNQPVPDYSMPPRDPSVPVPIVHHST